MVQAFFYLRFKNQLRRTRPEIVSRLDDAFTAAVSSAGGSLDQRQNLLSASFGEPRSGFLLDMLLFLETIRKKIEENGKELLGHALFLGSGIPEDECEGLCRNLSASKVSGFSGIWCGRELWRALEPYVVFDYKSGKYGELKTLENPKPSGIYPHREKIHRALLQGPVGNMLVVGPPFIGKMDGVYQYCKTILGEIPPLAIRFGSGNPCCFADAYTEDLRSFLSNELGADSKQLEELDYLGEILSKERLRNELFPALVETARRFLKLLVSAYGEAVNLRKQGSGTPAQNAPAVILLEDISESDGYAAVIFQEYYRDIEKKGGFLIIGTGALEPSLRDFSVEERFKSWIKVFPNFLNLPSRDFPVPNNLNIPFCLVEISYTFSVMGRFFPPRIFPLLFEEEGLNSQIPAKAQEMLIAQGLINKPEDPCPRITGFLARAEQFLEKSDSLTYCGKDKIHAMIRNRLLAWVDSGRLNPCFALLGMLKSLGYKAQDSLILRIIREDVFTGVYKDIEKFAGSGGFSGAPGGSAMLRIFKALKALVWESGINITRVFDSLDSEESPENSEQVPETQKSRINAELFPGFKAQMLVNLGSYKLGTGDLNGAEKAIKEAVLINQSLRDKAVSAYRLFSLVNLAKHSLNDAMEYIHFAVDQNGQYAAFGNRGKIKKTDEFTEQVKALYFAAVINFIYGNLSKAEHFALMAEELAGETGMGGEGAFGIPSAGIHSEWAAKSRFLRGRIRFESGEYQDALVLFSSLTADVSGGPSLFTPDPGDRDKTIAAWIYRTKVYARTLSGGILNGNYIQVPEKPAFPNSDGRLFIAEAAFLAGDYKEALSLTEEFLRENDPGMIDQTVDMFDNGVSAESENDEFFYTEQPDWGSGFSQCENIVIKREGSMNRLARIYRAMSLCNLGVSEEASEEISTEWQDFLRHELLPDGDPGDVFYYYAYYYILQKIESSRVDMGTMVSMGFKRLQRRAVRIDDDKVRQSYITKNYWNRILNLTAKEYRLI